MTNPNYPLSLVFKGNTFAFQYVDCNGNALYFSKDADIVSCFSVLHSDGSFCFLWNGTEHNYGHIDF